MQQIDWNKLGLIGESKQRSFEDLCMYLCCRELRITKIEAYQDQPGIETEPFEVKGKMHGFQAKYFESRFDWKQIEHSIAGEKDKNSKSNNLNIQYPNNVFNKYQVKIIYLYSNKDRTRDGRKISKTEIFIEKLAKKNNSEVKYLTKKHLSLKLSIPSNLDLAQLYFGIGDELSFVKNSINPKLLTFIQSSEYIELPFIDKNKKLIKRIDKEILSKKQKLFLLLGHPGSGKTVFIHKLLQLLGGLGKDDESKMIKTLINNNAVPVLINLKNCKTDSLENILRDRKNDCRVSCQNLNFV